MSEDVKSALTPERWVAAFASDWPSGTNPRKYDGVFRDDETPDVCHYIAALALHGQSFGFTHDDVELLREISCCPPHNADCAGLAARIEALLPPETP